MKKLRWILLILISVTVLPVHAEDAVLRVAADQFTSPLVMQGKNQLYGFDIAMMSYICPLLKRTCQYKVMPFDQLLTAVANKQADIALGGITITPDRAKIVNFSQPYLVSKSRFLGRSKGGPQTITLKILETSKIGFEKGTIFAEEINRMGLSNPSIVNFDREGDVIEALTEGSIDLALLDESTAIYWQGHSAGELIALGEPIDYGFGFGIAVNKDDTDLLDAINQAIVQYLSSKDFKTNYDMYLGSF